MDIVSYGFCALSNATQKKVAACAGAQFAVPTKENDMYRQARFLALVPLLVATALGMAACGGGSSMTPATSQVQASQMNQVRLSVADAPVDNATHVVVVFTGV